MDFRLNFPNISRVASSIGREFKRIRDDRARIRDDRAVVERFRKEIDKNCGPGMGEKLIRSVGGYKNIFNPRLNELQTTQLELRVAQVEVAGPPPKGMKQVFDSEHRVKWVSSHSLSTKALKFMEDRIGEFFNRSVHLPDRPSAERIDVNFRTPVPPADLDRQLEWFVGGSETVAGNLSILSGPEVIDLADKRFAKLIESQHGWSAEAEIVTRECAIDNKSDHYEASYVCRQRVTALVYPNGKRRFVDPERSHLTLKIPRMLVSHADVAAGKIDRGLKLVGRPKINLVIYPVPGAGT
jgi:hypothetical protein